MKSPRVSGLKASRSEVRFPDRGISDVSVPEFTRTADSDRVCCMGSDEVVESEILEGADLCVGCLFPVRPGSELCVKCGAPHGELAGFLPFLRVLAEGHVYRQAVQNPKSWLSVVGV